MAAVISETIADSSRFHMMRRDGRRHSPSSSQRQASRSHSRVPPSPRPQPTSTVPSQTAANVLETPSAAAPRQTTPQQPFASQQHITASDPVYRSSAQGLPLSSQSHTTGSRSSQQGASTPNEERSLPQPARLPYNVAASEGRTVKVRDLAHIQSFATEEFLAQRNHPGRRHTSDEISRKYEISGMPIMDIIEMVAGLLTKITTTNDRQHENMNRPVHPPESAATTPGLTSSVLAFHGRNVPTISILSYLSRIHKYCPTTYEVFLSLLVYFDRMTERVNAGPIRDLRRDVADQSTPRRTSTTEQIEEHIEISRPSTAASSASVISETPSSIAPSEEEQMLYNLSHFFVVDSFNIHRLVIAGVTCASKFFSDVFYTNSRYAKVGGLPLAELNHLELQFLLLNDFRLSVPVEELEAYGTMLVEFYAREVVAQIQNTTISEDMDVDDDVPEDAADSD